MSLFKCGYSFLFIVFSTTYLFSNITALPIENENPYNKFIDVLVNNNCTMPEQVELPFPQTSNESHFSFLSEPLKECQTPNAAKENVESMFLCNEIFDVLENITCPQYGPSLPKIKNPLSEDICIDFKSKQDIFPKGVDYLSGKLADSILCKVLCSRDYELLCKTLLWSYGVQEKIKNFLENNVKVNEKANTDQNVASKMVTQDTKINLTKLSSSSKQASDEITNNNANVDNTDTEDEKNLQVVPNSSNEKSSTGTLSAPSDTTLDKTVNLTNNTLTGTNAITTSVPKATKVSVIAKNVSESDNKKTTNNDGTSPVEPSQNPSSKQNEVNIDSNISNLKTLSTDTNANSLTSEMNSVTDKNRQNIPLNNLPEKDKTTSANSDIGPETNVNSNNLVPHDNEMDNELNNVNIEGEEKEGKVKQTSIKTDDKDKNAEKPKLIDFETPLGSSDVDLKEPEFTTLQILPDKADEDVEHQDDKEQEQYNDTENEGDYPKSEYDNSFNPPLRSKEPISKSSIVEGSNQMSNSYDTLVSSRNNIGRVPDDIRMISSFPEQEDSHFFFYFLSVVLILMAGYLIFHNKQKIIALIVEGRHERRRRSHGAGYKKLETK